MFASDKNSVKRQQRGTGVAPANAANIASQRLRVEVALLISIISLTGCATNFKTKSLGLTLTGASLGTIYGSTRPEFKDQNTLMYASVGAALGSLAALYIFDPDKQIESLTTENKNLKTQLKQEIEPKVLYSGPGIFHSKIPEKYQRLIDPGEWKISEVDEWFEDSENHLIHQDKIMELTPPALRPQGTERSTSGAELK